MNSPNAEAELNGCSNLLNALLKVRSLGLNAGSIELSTDELHGWVTYSGHKITRAVIAETAQTGNDALGRLVEVDGAKCRYLTPAERIEDGLKDPTATIASLPSASGSQSAQRPSQSWQEEREALFTDLVRDQRAEFLHADGRLDDEEAPARRDTHFNRQLMDTSKSEETEAILARAGFVSDFHDSAPQLTDAWSNFHGDPAKLKNTEFKVDRARSRLSAYLWPGALAALCISIYVVPAMIWRLPATDTDRGDKDMRALVDGTVRELDRENSFSERSSGFSLPAAPPPAATPPSATGSGDASTSVGSTVKETAKSKLADRSDQNEYGLADDRSTLPQLEQLIYQYIAKKDFKRARGLAGAGFRSRVATAEEKQKFWQIYLQCLGK